MRKLSTIGNVLIPAGTALTGLVLWEYLVRLYAVPAHTLPGPLQILHQFIQSFPMMLYHLKYTLFTALMGLLVSVVTGLVASALMDRIHILKKALYPFIVVSQAVPIIFIYPLLVIWFGFGLIPKILIVVLVCFFPICVNMVDGLAQVDPDLIHLFRSMKASDWYTFVWVRLPSALPHFFSGLKISATYAVIGAVISEWLGAKQGVAVFMIRSFRSYATDKVFASILLIILSSLMFMGVVLVLERIVLSWKFRRKVWES